MLFKNNLVSLVLLLTLYPPLQGHQVLLGYPIQDGVDLRRIDLVEFLPVGGLEV